ncbi:hypothetical protein WSM22_38680 [Cytophagales bacterium WSM2-2]|nr:hypothetical protein WSM22_38680 [Cytophagales bacterium WSM2-2]
MYSLTNSTFIDKITSDFRRNSFFISVKAIDGTNYVIENDDLYYFLQKQKSIGKEQYRKEIKEKLIKGSSIEISNPNSNFIKVVNVSTVEASAKKGIDEFIKTYFNKGKVLKAGITNNERTAIIQKLFVWEIASKIDDETGYLVISR